MKKRVLSLILAFAMILSCVPTAFATGTDEAADSDYVGPLGLTVAAGDAEQPELTFASGESESETGEEAEEEEVLTKFEESGIPRFSENGVNTPPEADEIVTFIVVTEEKPQLELYSMGDIAKKTAAVQSHESKQQATLNAVKASVQAALGEQEGFKLGFTYTIATTGFSVSTAYGNKALIEAMDGVKSVYVAPTFSLPEDGMDQTYEEFTNNATTMIGANVLNESGYTGKGMRIAILDTGIKVDHPNFAALPEEKLEDPMTRDSVERIWDYLHASQMTNMLNVSYYNSKLPFIFNYAAGNFDVANTYARSDHGTHVAGIAAANKVEGVNVAGVAPDAQLVVMQVFQSGGGASWATIMAALEDCVRLEVDAANLSLGAAAGFVDPDDDMLATLNRFLDTDIQVLIASGNDTNNAFMNAWGGNMSLITDPDIGLAGTPSTYSAALAVASADNNGYEQMYITVGGTDHGFQDTATTSATAFISNFRNQELEYVVVPGVGAEEDYEGLDVTGKVALISRGETSFPEKQALAQEKGAIAAVIYNNTVGFFAMQINDGEGNIPAVSISRSSGLAMIEQAGEDGIGTLKVCDADLKLFQLDNAISSFSSWGVTPSLTLKPEITGVGGSIYSTVDPAISGSSYGYMSGTSMATPQITGAMAVLIEYLDKNYPELTGADQRKVAANLLMSTADPIMASDTLETTPRAQGAGLANLVKATTTPAYLSNPAAAEGRPKVEFGDDPAKTGVYTFSFTINNLSDETLVYEIDSSVITESIYGGYFIANSPYGLEAKVEVAGPVTVPANGTATVNATLTLTENDKAYLNQFPNGIYVEGFVYAVPANENAEGVQEVTLTMPMVGFYGDWSDADIFDDPVNYSLYPSVVFTYMSQLGTNPYFRNGASGDEYNAFSYANPLAEIDFGQLRNAKRMDIYVTDKETGEVYYTIDGSYMAKTYYNASYGMIIPTYLMVEYGEVWDGMDAKGNKLPDGTTITYHFDAWLDDGDDIMDDSWSFDATLDNQAPELVNAYELQENLRFEGERTYLTLEILENEHVAAVMFLSDNGSIMGKFEINNTPGELYTGEFDITGFGGDFTILVADYACNETEFDASVNLGDQNNAVPTPVELSKDRLYGNETFDGALVEGGWFSANKADFSDPRNETFDSANRYYAAEYVNGYLIGQNTNTGHLELITPSGTYWSAKVLAENYGSMGDPNVWVLYDMALDHSGTLSASYGVNWETNATDALLAVGWLYRGDMNNDGHDDGYNALFNIKFTSYGSVLVQDIAPIVGVEGDLLTLGITTEGEVYGIGTDGVLYSVATTTEWDETYGEWGENVIRCTEIGETSFVNYPNYGGANVIQSMGYDHNTDTMYWYAHSQVLDPSGAYYHNVNVTYTVDLTTGECTEVGTYGPGGQTCLFVPNDLESDLFTMGAEPSGLQITPDYTTMVEGQTKRLEIKWTPWNATPADVTWSTGDETIATVDEYGFVTAHAEGEVVISATAVVNVEPYWDYDENWNWVQFPGGPTETTANCLVKIVPSQDELYGFIVEDFGNAANNLSWVTYSDKALADVNVIGKQYLTVSDMDGNEHTSEPIWAGGTYYNGYVYTVVSAQWVEDNTIYTGTELYRSKVTEGATPDQTTIGEPEFIGVQEGMMLSAMGFDYNTGRMYVVENQSVGGLGILDLDTGKVDMLGLPNGDLSGAVYIPGLCVTADGTIVISDAVASLYTIDPDTLTTQRIHTGNGSPYTAFYEAMFYDYNTGSIYWNMCDGNGASPLYMVRLTNDWGYMQAEVMELGGVSTKRGTQQTVLFTIPENEPETKQIPVESIEIVNGDAITGLEGGQLQLSAVTTPARPTVQTKTWTSSDESVVSVDNMGVLTYHSVGTATVTVSITNKDEATYGGPFTDSIEVTVLEAAGEFVAFLNSDEGGSQYYDFWLRGNDYDLRHVSIEDSMIAIYSLRTGVYYDGYFYGYNDKGQFLRIDAEDPADYTILGNANLDYNKYQVTGMAMDYTTGTLYGLTLTSDYSFETWEGEEHVGQLVTIDLNTGLMTPVGDLDFDAPVYALACDADGQLYAAGGYRDYYSTNAVIYKLDKQTAEQTAFVNVPGAGVYTGPTYYGSAQYNTQMAYDFTTNRLYLYATSDHQYYSDSFGMFMVQLGENPVASKLDGISLWAPSWQSIKYGEVYLGLLAFIPEEDEVPSTAVNGIILNKTSSTIAVGETTQLIAEVRPSNAADASVTWESSDPGVATVDENGLVTAVSVGSTIITVTSNETGVSATCLVTVINVDGPTNMAYTVSATKDALISFDPLLPGQTAEVVCRLNGGSTIAGMAYGDNCLYYIANENWNYMLYRFDLNTKQSTSMGQLYLFGDPTGLAYDKDNNLFYATSGFYLFQFDGSSLDPAAFNYYTNYMMDSDYCNLTGVSVIDGAVYTFGNDYYSSAPKMMKYSDKYLSDRTVVLEGFDMSFVQGATDIAYNPGNEMFYMTDAGHNIFAMDWDGNVALVDILGDGIDMHGLAIDPDGKYYVTYTDGVEGETVFADQVYGALEGAATPAYAGNPTRPGYTFAGWTPEVAETVTDHVTYTATWTANTYTITFDTNGGTCDTETKTVTFGEPIGELPVATKSDFTFAGWYTLDGTEYTAETVYTVADDLTLTAQWDEIPVQFISYTATLGGSIGMNFYVKLARSVLEDPTSAMTFNFAGKLITVPLSEAVEAQRNGQTVYRFTCNVAAKYMADTITAQMVNAEGNVGKSASTSVVSYCNFLLANYDDSELTDLVKAMLNYGAAAQLQFNYNILNLANAALSDEEKVLADVDASAYKHTITGHEDGIEIYSISLLLDSDTTLRVYYNLTGTKTIDEFEFTVNGVTAEPGYKDGRYYVDLPGIGAHRLGVPQTFTVGGLTMRYSVMSYVNTVLQVSDSETLRDVAKALYAYAMAAEAYKN